MTDNWKDFNSPEHPENRDDSFNFPYVSFDPPVSEESAAENNENRSDHPASFQASGTQIPPAEDESVPQGAATPSQEASAANQVPPAPQSGFSASGGAADCGQQPGSYNSGSQYGGGFPPYGQPPVYSPTGGWQTPPPPVQPPKKKAGTAQKVFLSIIGSLAAVLVICFVGWGIGSSFFSSSDLSESPSPSSGSDSEVSGEENADPVPERPPVSVGQGGTIQIQDLPAEGAMSPKDVYKKVSRSVVGIVSGTGDKEEKSGEGTGIIATSDGYIITNSHVVNDSRYTSVKIVTRDNREYPGVVVGYDRTTDLAVIKIDAKGLPPAEFGNTDKMEIGDTVLAIGNPGGLKFSSSMTRGIISALNRNLGSNSQKGMTYIQTDAAINPGNSGGALVNLYGQVIGINSSKLVAEDFEGMGFAIPVSRAQDILNNLMNMGYVEGRPRLGITGHDVSEQQSAFYGVPAGFLILEIGEDSDIGKAGGKVQDIICGVNGQDVTGLSDISDLLLDYAPGDKITLTLYRISEEKNFDITVTLLEDKGETQDR